MFIKRNSIFIGILVLAVFMAVSACSNLTGDKTVAVSKGKISVCLDVGNSSKTRGSIQISSNQILSATISLTDPAGVVQNAYWTPGNSTTFTFNTSQSGDYTITEQEVDGAGNTSTATKVLNVQNGWNYTVIITIGGNILMQINAPANSNSSVSTNYTSSSVSSSFSNTGSVTPYDGSAMITVTPIPGQGWFGGSLYCENGYDISGYESGNLVFYLNSKKDSIGVTIYETNDGGQVSSDLINYGFVPDGQWHKVTIPIATFGNKSLTDIAGIFAFILSPNWDPNDATPIYIDNIYFEKNNSKLPVYSESLTGNGPKIGVDMTALPWNDTCTIQY